MKIGMTISEGDLDSQILVHVKLLLKGPNDQNKFRNEDELNLPYFSEKSNSGVKFENFKEAPE